MEVSLSFLSELPLYATEKPYDIYREVPAGVPTSNCEFEEHHNIKVYDVRKIQSSFDLDSSGFKLLRAPSKIDVNSIDFKDRTSDSTMVYLRDTVNLVKEELGANRVLCFDWRLRKRTSPTASLSQQPHNLDYDRFEALETAKIVHADLGFELTQLSVWRPFVAVVQDNPIAFCDRRTVRREDLISVDKIHEDHWEEGLYMYDRPWHKWYWVSDQTSDEVTLFVTWDSKEGNTVACPPHVSFINPLAKTGYPARKSVEVRLMVFTWVGHNQAGGESFGEEIEK
ncbi:hypothetical protein BP5796_09803 [Coleophoma crateriformis]|uniref:Uncharacterized protein n=1 Tax=Coleophoma crateriformis TaxID=565419 RepID=A0A3D8QZQ3_9HELO|nr:hypothetical protein BP5796_09803 [Coleophoma crateriformis]